MNEIKIIGWEIGPKNGARAKVTCLECCPNFVPRAFIDCAIYSDVNETNTSGPPLYCHKCNALIALAGMDWPG